MKVKKKTQEAFNGLHKKIMGEKNINFDCVLISIRARLPFLQNLWLCFGQRESAYD